MNLRMLMNHTFLISNLIEIIEKRDLIISISGNEHNINYKYYY